MSDNSDHYHDALLEEIRSDVKGLAEAVATLLPLPQKVDKIDARLQNVEDDIHVIKLVLTDHSGTIKAHEDRLTTLEQKPA